jgi:hypothetical protein
MRTCALAIALYTMVTPARAERLAGLSPRAFGVDAEGHDLDFHGQDTIGVGLTTSFRIGGGRWQALGEVGIGRMIGFGNYVLGRVGGRFLVSTLSTRGDYAADFVLDAGVGAERDWIASVPALDRPSAFVGWGMLLRFSDHRAIDFVLRLSASPRLDDESALRVICHGTCPTTDLAPADLAFMLMIGGFAW